MCLGLKKSHSYTLEETVGDVTVDYDTLKRTPMDYFLYYRRCCFCINLRTGAALTCLLCFLWGAAEIIVADKFMARIFPERDNYHKYCKFSYQFVVILFLFATIVFAVGVAKRDYILITIFTWCAFVFHLVYIVVYLITVCFLMYGNRMTKKVCFRVVGSIFWNFFFCYLLIVVNSYRISLWILDQLMEDIYT